MSMKQAWSCFAEVYFGNAYKPISDLPANSTRQNLAHLATPFNLLMTLLYSVFNQLPPKNVLHPISIIARGVNKASCLRSVTNTHHDGKPPVSTTPRGHWVAGLKSLLGCREMSGVCQPRCSMGGLAFLRRGGGVVKF